MQVILKLPLCLSHSPKLWVTKTVSDSGWILIITLRPSLFSGIDLAWTAAMEQGILCFQIMAKSLAPLTGTTTPFPSVGLWNKFWSCLCMRAVRVISVCLRPLEVQLVKTNIWTSVSFLATEKASRTMYRRKESMATCITSSNKVGQCESVAGAGLQLTIIPLLKTFTHCFLIYRGRGEWCVLAQGFSKLEVHECVYIPGLNTFPFLHFRYKHPLENLKYSQ